MLVFISLILLLKRLEICPLYPINRVEHAFLSFFQISSGRLPGASVVSRAFLQFRICIMLLLLKKLLADCVLDSGFVIWWWVLVLLEHVLCWTSSSWKLFQLDVVVDATDCTRRQRQRLRFVQNNKWPTKWNHKHNWTRAITNSNWHKETQANATDDEKD